MLSMLLVTTHDKLLSARWLKDVILSVGLVPKSPRFISLSCRFLNIGYFKTSFENATKYGSCLPSHAFSKPYPQCDNRFLHQ